MRSLAFFLLALLCAGGARAQQPLALDNRDAGARAVVQAARSWQVARARELGVEPQIATARIDLNGDGQAEIVATLQTPQKCAAMGLRDCPLIVLRAEGARYVEVGTFFGDAVQLLDSRSQGWLDFESRFTRGPWRRTLWNGTMYRLVR
ncbi:hypothetical protein [Roseomonas sp. 18066]|uniref:hypothetical protein n=1 Tax=Roseomonas sp. 18066 TaxID=2681412 RepID=UPI0013570E2C|nr:hypothetical protein [Roseomonas sp. 18066]